jgi:hypothetical protein
MKSLPTTQEELNEFFANKLFEQSNQLLSTQILLYSIVDLVIEKELVSKEELEEMIEAKKVIVQKFIKDEASHKQKDDSSYMMHFGKPGEA